MSSLFRLLISFSLFLSTFSSMAMGDQSCESKVESIQVSGNDITQRSLLIQWSGLQPGLKISASHLAEAKQNLLDTGLYSEVQVQAANLCNALTRVNINIKEKSFHFIYPRINRNGDGDIDRGVKYKANNLFGADQTLTLSISKKDYASGDNAHRIKIKYELPRFDIPYKFRWSIFSSEKLLSDTTSEITETDRSINFSVGRDWVSHPFQYPITVLATLGLSTKSLSGSDPAIETTSGDYRTIGLGLEYDAIHNDVNRRYGHFYAVKISRGFETLGSDFQVNRLMLESRHFKRLNELDNLNIRLKLKLASKKLFNKDLFDIGGVSTIRGIESDLITGNSLWQANIEYLKGFKRWPFFRTAFFTDIANVFPGYDDFNLDNWQQTFGLGLRWKLKSFVDTDLVIDYAYDPGTHYSKIYAATSLEF